MSDETLENENEENLPAVSSGTRVGQKQDYDKFFTMPNSPASNTMINVVSHASDLEVWGSRIEANSHSSKLEFFQPPENAKLSQRVKYTTDNTETTIHLDNIDLFSKANKPLKKIMTYTLIKLARENVTETLDRDITIKFPLQDLVDLGSYKSIATARQAFNLAKNPMTSIKIEGVVKDKKDLKNITDSGIEVLFTGAHIKNGIVEIYLNKRINWEIFALQYFSIIPKTYFSLSDNAADTLLNIFMIARKRLNDLERKEKFTISFRTLQQILDLPDEKNTKNPSRDIKEAILQALDDINEIEKGDIIIKPVYNSNGNIVEFLEEGYAEISLYNEYKTYFLNLAHSKSIAIENTKKKRAEIAEKAQIKALADKSKAEKKTKK